MIGKLLLIAESGLLPFYFNQDNIQIDNDLLSALCRTIYSLSVELNFPLKNIGFENHKIIAENFKSDNNQKFLLMALFDEYHIDTGIKNKLKYVFERFFKGYEFSNGSRRINNPELNEEVKNILNDVPLEKLIINNLDKVNELLNPVIQEPENSINAYALTSSNNNILYFNAIDEFFRYRQGDNLKEILKEYLFAWKLEKIPQGDIFIGTELPNGLDLKDYYETGQKTCGLLINTSINLTEEPNNELLLYFFGKNMLMRSCVPDIEEKLRTALSNA